MSTELALRKMLEGWAQTNYQNDISKGMSQADAKALYDRFVYTVNLALSGDMEEEQANEMMAEHTAAVKARSDVGD